jgi:hypothetical protein
LYLVIRVAEERTATVPDRAVLARQVKDMLPLFYRLRLLDPRDRDDRWQRALDLSWAQNVHVLLKPEEEYEANSWPFYYTTFLWQSNMVNDMEALCRALVNFPGEALVDITLIPTEIDGEEWSWVDRCTLRMRDDMNGLRVHDSEHTDSEVFDPMPGLRTPLENYESWLERYSQNPLYLYSVRVFASKDPSGLSQLLATSATQSTPTVMAFEEGHAYFDQLLEAGETVDIMPEIRSEWWYDVDKDEPLSDQRPLRAQRFVRLTDVDEISGFWRLPIPVKLGFPGFGLDVGRGDRPKQEAEQLLLLGDFTDETPSANGRAMFDREGLTKHSLVVGVPGSGKTTMMFSLLHQLWRANKSGASVPFLVLEPAKTEYRALKSLPGFQDDLLVFTLGDERTSPFRFNPFQVPEGTPLESHISRLNACFVGAFNLFDPLPLLLDKAIREMYQEKGWLDDSVGGEMGVETPTLSDLCRVARQIIERSGYSQELRNDFNAALVQRLDSLRRGSKGRMLDTPTSVPFELLMERPVILELDALNGSEKALLMMFILTFVYEYAKTTRHYGTDLQHVLLIEEAHNLISRNTGSSEYRANPQAESNRLFIRMLAEMRALGQGILIADQLPTAIAPEAMKQTNLKVLMRMTAMDDRMEIGNTMDLGEEHLKAVTRFKPGQAYAYHEGWDRVRLVQTVNFKKKHDVSVPFSDAILSDLMEPFESQRPRLYMPYPECEVGCETCDRRTRSYAERFVRSLLEPVGSHSLVTDYDTGPVCNRFLRKAKVRTLDFYERYGSVKIRFPFCAYVHLLHQASPELFKACEWDDACLCQEQGRDAVIQMVLEAGRDVKSRLEQEEKDEGA